MRCRNEALAGNLKALAFLLNRYRLIAGDDPNVEAPLDEAEREVWDSFVKGLEEQIKAKKE